MTLDNKLRELIDQVAPQLSAQEVQFAQDFLAAGEFGEVIYLIATQLYEREMPVSRTTFSAINELGTKLGMSPDQWTMLLELIPADQ